MTDRCPLESGCGLGADHARVLRLVLSEGVALVGMGMLIGVPGVYLAGRLLRAVLVDVSPSDPAILLTVAAGLALVALAACYLPARRALRIEPAPCVTSDIQRARIGGGAECRPRFGHAVSS
jgi:hypothetical protein